MAQDVVSGLNAAKDAVASQASKAPQNKKVADLARDMQEEYGPDQHATTDYGIKISDHDHTLKIASDQHTGPQLLEDQIAREKVRRVRLERRYGIDGPPDYAFRS